jgi:hypothetical protein
MLCCEEEHTMGKKEYGAGSVFKRGQRWWIAYGFRGDMHRESAGKTRPRR